MRESTNPEWRSTIGGPLPVTSWWRSVTFETVASAAVDYEHVLVVGAGQMGGGIAQVIAASGRRVSLHDPYPGATDRALAAMRKSLAKLAEKGGADPDDVLSRVVAADE